LPFAVEPIAAGGAGGRPVPRVGGVPGCLTGGRDVSFRANSDPSSVADSISSGSGSGRVLISIRGASSVSLPPIVTSSDSGGRLSAEGGGVGCGVGWSDGGTEAHSRVSTRTSGFAGGSWRRLQC
jgi:hypothetical protein